MKRRRWYYKGLEEILDEQNHAWVEYVQRVTDSIGLPAQPRVPLSNVLMRYSDSSLRSGSIYVKMDENAPCYRKRVIADYTAVGGERVGTWFANDGRIDQGVALDGRQKLNICFALDYSTTSSGTDSIEGQGTDDPHA